MSEEIQQYDKSVNEYGTCLLDVSGQWKSIHKVIVTSLNSIMDDQETFFVCVSPPLYPKIVRIQGYKDPNVGARGINGGVVINIKIYGVGRSISKSLHVSGER